MKRYFHRIHPTRVAIFQRRGCTWAWIKERYYRPRWCALREALDGEMGCWDLVMRAVHRREDCRDCEYRKGTP